MLFNAETCACGCSMNPNRCGNCRFTKFATEHGEKGEIYHRNKRREKWNTNRKISADRTQLPLGPYHYIDEYMDTLLPCDFDEHYKCDNCQMNHIEEDCPRKLSNATKIKGKQRLGHIDTKKEYIDNMRLSVVKKNEDLAAEDEKLHNGYKFCFCCCYLVSPNDLNEAVTFHPSPSVTDIGEPHESYRYAVYGYACCEQKEGAIGCCIHTHVFE